MRIVYYSPGWPPAQFPNGIVTALDRLVPALRALGSDARILAQRGEAVRGLVDIVGETPEARESMLMRAARRFVAPGDRIFRQTPVRIVQAISGNPDLQEMDIFEIEESFGWSKTIAPRIAAPTVVRLHGPWFMNGAVLKEGALTRLDEERIRREGEALAAAEAVTAPSKFVLDAVREQYGLRLPDAAVIPNPAPVTPEEIAWRADSADFNEILFVGRSDRHKGADIVLKAFAALAGGRPGLKLVFAGPNDRPLEADGKEYAGASEYAATIMPPEILRRIAFLGSVPSSSLEELRARAGVTVIASRVETFGNVLIEAMAHGSPVVATRAGALSEIARDGETALLAQSEDADDLARNIAALLDDRALAARLGENARRSVRANYAPESAAQRTLEAYRDIIGSRSGRNRAAGS